VKVPSQGERVNRAIDRGLAFLRNHDKGLKLPQRYEGLLGLTLLECGVPTTNPLVVRLAESLRAQAPRLTATYELSTAIFFFDRLGRGEDGGLIPTLAERLVDGQDEGGTWSYWCPLRASESGPLFSPVGGGQGRARIQWRAPNSGDHSNTQFATLALWIARRHRSTWDIQEALARVAQHFRDVQETDGCWGYTSRQVPRPPSFSGPSAATGGQPFRGFGGSWAQDGRRSWTGFDDGKFVPFRPGGLGLGPMPNPQPILRGQPAAPPTKARPMFSSSSTCAGLLALAVGHALGHGRGSQALNDQAVVAALRYLGKAIADAPDRKGVRLLDGLDDAYTLWSIERVGTLYSLQHIGKKAWYPWAAEWLVRAQLANGSWQHGCGDVADTCFALLVLRRSNLAPDLTYALSTPKRTPGTPPPRRLKEGVPAGSGTQQGPTNPRPSPRVGVGPTHPPDSAPQPVPQNSGTEQKTRAQKTP
jgi:hypothetical protein